MLADPGEGHPLRPSRSSAEPSGWHAPDALAAMAFHFKKRRGWLHSFFSHMYRLLSPLEKVW